MASDSKLRVAIIGAGIAGLAAAIALQRDENIDVQIYERTDKLREIGATIALGPNGLKTLERLGVYDALDNSVAFRNKSGNPMIYRHYQTNEVVSVDTHSQGIQQAHHTSRFFRPHLQQALLRHVDPSKIHLGKGFQSAKVCAKSDELIISFTDSSSITADVLLGADGIHSAVRKHFVPTSGAKWTGWVTFRSVFPAARLKHIAELPDEAVHIWGPDRTLFLSPLAQDLFAVVGSYQSDPDAPDAPYKDSTWNSDGEVDQLREFYKNWNPVVRSIIDATPYTKVYPNAAAAGLESWILGDGRVTLAGDAAHAHGGAFAAGGSLALDDAWAFAKAILQTFSDKAPGSKKDKIRQSLLLYERARKQHTDRVQNTVQVRNQKLVQRIGQSETDEQLRKRMQSRESVSWIHEHDVEEAFQRALAPGNEPVAPRL